jgi:hypothetical protein
LWNAKTDFGDVMKTLIMQNLFLAELPFPVREALSPFLEMIEVHQSSITSGAGLREDFIYFPLNCLCSIDLRMTDGFHAHLALLGFREAAGLHRYAYPPLPGTTRVLAGGYALQMPLAAFEKQFVKTTELQRAIQGSMARMMRTLGHATACNLHHSLQKRLSRWLLCAADATAHRHFEFTHEELASILGVRREAVTEALARLSIAGAVETSRGKIAIKDEALLRDSACDCHEVPATRLHSTTQAGGERWGAIPASL